MLKILIKLWPSITVLIIYGLIVHFIRKKRKKSKIIEGEFEIIDENDKKRAIFSLNNPIFVTILHISLIFLIISLFYLALNQKLVDDQQSYEKTIEKVKFE